MQTFRAKKNSCKAFINPNIFDALLWESFLLQNNPKFEAHKDFFEKTFQIPSKMVKSITRLKSLSKPFELDFFYQLREHFEENEYSIQEKLALVGNSLLLNRKLKILRNWFNVMDFQLLKAYIKNFEKLLTPQTITHFAQLSSQSGEKMKLSIFEETIQNLLLLQQKLCSNLSLGGIRQIVESASFFKINHLLYPNQNLLALKVSTLIALDMKSMAEVLVYYFLAMRKSCLGLLRKSMTRNHFQKLLEINTINLQDSFDQLGQKFKFKLASNFQKDFRESKFFFLIHPRP
jgi:hypothetical protein